MHNYVKHILIIQYTNYTQFGNTNEIHCRPVASLLAKFCDTYMCISKK